MNSHELLERSNQEREKIFERYELGREAPIDSWEDPEANVYSKIDRWEMICETKIELSSPSSHKFYAYTIAHLLASDWHCISTTFDISNKAKHSHTLLLLTGLTLYKFSSPGTAYREIIILIIFYF